MKQLEIRFGAFAPALSEQLAEQGAKFKSGADGAWLQKAADSITYLRVHGLLSDTELDKTRKRLMGKITAAAIAQAVEVGKADDGQRISQIISGPSSTGL